MEIDIDNYNGIRGCYNGTGSGSANTYWMDDLRKGDFGLPTHAIPQAQADKKPLNCAMPMMYVAFCAWDGGELARTVDYHEIWGRRPTAVGATNVFIPWAALLNVGDFNWRNGHGLACSPSAWPGCVNPQPIHYFFPAGGDPANDDTPAIGAPGRFPLDITATTSANGEGWYDVGGNLMEAAWPVGTVNPGVNQIRDVCDQTAGVGPGDTECSRQNGNRTGVLRYTGDLPHIALVGYSFEAHARRSEGYLASLDGAETRIGAGDLKPITFQYGKVGGRCAR
jgi:hypothetical protein